MDFVFNALLGAATVTVEQPIDGQTGVWIKVGDTVISSAMRMRGAVVSSGQSMHVYNRGVAINCVGGVSAIIHSGGVVSGGSFFGGTVSAGGTAIGMSATTSAGEGATTFLFAGAAVQELHVGRYAALCLNYANVSGATVFSGGRFRCFGGSACNVVIGAPRTGMVNELIVSNATVSGVSQLAGVLGSAQVTIRGNAVVYDVVAVETWKINQSAGLASGIVLNSGATMTMSGGTGAAVTVSSGGVFIVSSGGQAVGAALLDGGVAYISSGAALSAADQLGGNLAVSVGGAISGIAASGGNLLVNAGSATEVDIRGGNVIVNSDGSATAVRQSSGFLQVSAGGRISGASVATHLHVYSGGSALAVVSSAGAVVTVDEGGYIEYA